MVNLIQNILFHKKPKLYPLLVLVCIQTLGTAKPDLDSMLMVTGEMYRSGQYDKMLELSTIGEEFVLNTTELDSLKLMQFRGQKANALFRLDRYIDALAAYEEALAFEANTDREKQFKGNILHDKAFMEYKLEQFITSYKTTREAERLMASIEDPDYDYLLSIYGSLGREAAKLGYFEEGEYYLTKGMSLHKENADKVIYLEPSKGITKPVLLEYSFVYLYSYAQEEEKMLLHLKELEELRKNKTFTPREELVYAVSLNFAADYYLVLAGDDYFAKKNLKNFDDLLSKAEIYLNRAMNHLDRQAFPSNYLQFRFNQAKKHLYAGEVRKAQKVNQEILSSIGENDGRKSFFMAQKALILMERGMKSQMLKEFKQMLEGIHSGDQALESDFSNFRPSTNIAHTGLMIQMADKLYDMYSDDSDMLEFISQLYSVAFVQFVNCYQGKGFNDKLKEYYEGAIGGILKMKFLGFGDDKMLPKYLNEIENIENHFAWQEFTQNQQLNSFQLPDSLIYKEVILRQALVNARKQKDQLLIFELEDQLSKFKEYIKDSFPKLFSFVYERFDYKVLREDLGENTLVLRYKKFRGRWYVFIISEDGLTLAQLLNEDVLDKQINSYIQTLTSMEENKDLGNWLLSNLIPVNWQEKIHLVIIPDKELRQLPFETLVEENNRYLIEQISISYAPHLIFSTNAFFHSKSSKQGDGVIIFAPSYEGNPTSEVAMRQLAYKLEGAEMEAKHLAESYYGRHFAGNQASKQNFMEYAPEAKILHLSMHADIDPLIPELSYLLFAGEEEEGKMYVEELYAMNLAANMAVLSACNTGKGLFNERKGYTSIHQAFTFAGVPTTLSSLWEVPDQTTQQIMKSFYQYLQKGLSKSSALQKAKVDYIQNCEDPNFNKPFFWAGFVLNGDTSPLSLTSRSFGWGILLILFAISLGGWYWSKRSLFKFRRRLF